LSYFLRQASLGLALLGLSLPLRAEVLGSLIGGFGQASLADRPAALGDLVFNPSRLSLTEDGASLVLLTNGDLVAFLGPLTAQLASSKDQKTELQVGAGQVWGRFTHPARLQFPFLTLSLSKGELMALSSPTQIKLQALTEPLELLFSGRSFTLERGNEITLTPTTARPDLAIRAIVTPLRLESSSPELVLPSAGTLPVGLTAHWAGSPLPHKVKGFLFSGSPLVQISQPVQWFQGPQQEMEIQVLGPGSFRVNLWLEGEGDHSPTLAPLKLEAFPGSANKNLLLRTSQGTLKLVLVPKPATP